MTPAGVSGAQRAAEALAVLALAIAAAWLARALSVPDLVGLTRDDGTYVVYAKALLAGLGYVDPAEPGLPPANRYPIGFPLIIAAVLAGAGDWPAELARLGWIGPASLAAYVATCHVALRRLGGFPPWAALGAAAACALGHEVLYFGGLVLSDLPFATLALWAVLAGDRLLRRGDEAPAGWAAVGALIGAACLVRYAGVVLLAAAAGSLWRRGRSGEGPVRDQLALGLGFGAVMGPWLAYRLRLGGESYGANFADFLPAALPDLAPRVLTAAWRFAATGPASFFVPQAAGLAAAGWAVVGLAAGAVCAFGAYRWWRAPGPRDTPLPVLVLAATAALAAAWTVAFLHLEPALPTRLLLPVAPLLWIAAGRGGAALLAGSGVALRQAGPIALAACVALAAADVALYPRPSAGAREAFARDYQALFAAIRREVPPGERVLSRFHQMTWLYTGRAGHSIPAGLVDGRLAPLEPFALLLALEHWHISWIAEMPSLWAGVEDGGGAVRPFVHAYPAVVGRRWATDGGQAALHGLAPGPFAALCRELGVREINARYEALEPRR